MGKVMSLLFNTLSRFVIAFLPRNNWLLILWLQSPSAEILEPKKRNSVTASIFSSSICHKSDGTGCRDLSLYMYIHTQKQTFLYIKADFDIIEAESLAIEVQELVIVYELFRGFSGAVRIEQ